MNELYDLNRLKGKDVFNILNENRSSFDEYFWKYYKNFTMRNLKDYVQDICIFSKPTGRVLSLGCGHGLNEILLADMCRNVVSVVGVDVIEVKINSMNAIIKILGFENVKGVVGDGMNIDYPDGNFDCVMIIESLSHVNDQYRVLKEAVRVLKMDGTLFILDFNNGANPRILYKCWKENRMKGIVDENPVNPYFIRNRMKSIGIDDFVIQPYRFSNFFNNLGAKLSNKPVNFPKWIQLSMAIGFMLKGKK